jgi:ABC-2 type transport system permease protein
MSMKLLSAIRKEMLEVSHDRTMLAVLVIFPIFIMLFIGSSFRSMEISGLPIGVVGPQNTTFSQMLLSGLGNSTAFHLHDYGSESDAMDAFRNGQLKAVIIVPQDFEETLAKGNGSRIRIVVDNSDLALEQSIISAMSSVVQASSADMTKTYVTGAWKELGDLNESAAALGQDLAAGRVKMNQTKARLEETKVGMNELNISRLEAALDGAAATADALGGSLALQRGAVANASAENRLFMNDTALLLANASVSLNESIAVVEDTHGKLVNQTGKLNQTSQDLQDAITGLTAIRNMTVDAAIQAALDLDIMSLRSLQNSTLSQMADAQDETRELESLNTTLQGFKAVMENYSAALAEAETRDNSAAMLAAIDDASAKLESLNASFSSARSDVARLRTVIESVDSAMAEIDATLDQALAQTASVDNLILSLRDTVGEQTSRDPARIASPLSIGIQSQYSRNSFVDFLMPQVIAISLLFSCFLLASISLVREKTRNTIVRALLSPQGLPNLVLGKIISLVLLSLGQVAVILIVALLLFGVNPPSDYAMLIAATIVSALVLSSIGILIGFYARSESAAIQTCLLVAIPMLFLGNIIFSPDLLPNYTQILLQLLPLAHVTNMFKIVLITNGNPVGDMAALGTYFVLLAVVAGAIMLKRREITNYQ